MHTGKPVNRKAGRIGQLRMLLRPGRNACVDLNFQCLHVHARSLPRSLTCIVHAQVFCVQTIFGVCRSIRHSALTGDCVRAMVLDHASGRYSYECREPCMPSSFDHRKTEGSEHECLRDTWPAAAPISGGLDRLSTHARNQTKTKTNRKNAHLSSWAGKAPPLRGAQH